jgi:hypothetical protein
LDKVGGDTSTVALHHNPPEQPSGHRMFYSRLTCTNREGPIPKGIQRDVRLGPAATDAFVALLKVEEDPRDEDPMDCHLGAAKESMRKHAV